MTQTVRRGWLLPVAVWAGVTVGLVVAWRRARREKPAEAQLPRWLTGLARSTGTVVYDDPSLAMRVRLSRLMVIETAVAGLWLAFSQRRAVARAISGLVYQKSDPINLAVFRIVVFRQIYDACYFDFIERIASLPSRLQYPPLTGFPRWRGLARYANWPVHQASPRAIAIAGQALKYAAAMGMLGFCSRTSAAVVALLFVLVWGRLQWYGKVDHHHHLFWFAVLLALSPSGDALSVDRVIAMLRGKTPSRPGSQYGMPIAFCMMLMGVIYLFPGLWKMCRSGLDWAWSESPRMMLHREWRMYGNWLPGFRFDRYPMLYRGGTLAAMLFELSFIWMLLGRRTRHIAGILGTGFHLATQATLNIEFETLRNCYVLFVDWGRLVRFLTGSRATEQEALPPAEDRRFLHPSVIAGTLLLAGNAWAGAMRMTDGWPLACYPQFDGLSEPFYRTLRMTVTLADGSERFIDPDDYRDVFGNRWNNLLQRILQAGDEERKSKLRLIWQVLGRTESWVGQARKVRFDSVRSYVSPDRWDDEPDDHQLLLAADVEA